MGKLTVIGVRSLSTPGRYGDGQTLFLNISPGGSKSWIQRIVINRKRRDIGLGPFPVIGLAEARRRAFNNRVAVASGRDPLAEKRRATTPTFRQAAQRTFEAIRPSWRNNKTSANWLQQLEKRVFPVLGDMPVDSIGREDVLRVVTPIWTSKPEIARKLRQRIRATLRWCQAHGYIEHNVAGEAIEGALPSMPAVKAHFRALPYQEVGMALKVIDASRASLAAKSALLFLVLTAARSGEVRGARWSEIDLQALEWRVPLERMKTGVEHRVPLSGAAVAVLMRVRPLSDDSDLLVFPSPVRRGQPLSDMSLTKVLRTTGLADRATVHGYRTSFRTWASERTSVPHAVCEAALAHQVGSSVERSYARSDLFDKRRNLMDAWAAFVTGASAKVVKLG